MSKSARNETLRAYALRMLHGVHTRSIRSGVAQRMYHDVVTGESLIRWMISDSVRADVDSASNAVAIGQQLMDSGLLMRVSRRSAHPRGGKTQFRGGDALFRFVHKRVKPYILHVVIIGCDESHEEFAELDELAKYAVLRVGSQRQESVIVRGQRELADAGRQRFEFGVEDLQSEQLTLEGFRYRWFGDSQLGSMQCGLAEVTSLPRGSAAVERWHAALSCYPKDISEEASISWHPMLESGRRLHDAEQGPLLGVAMAVQLQEDRDNGLAEEKGTDENVKLHAHVFDIRDVKEKGSLKTLGMQLGHAIGISYNVKIRVMAKNCDIETDYTHKTPAGMAAWPEMRTGNVPGELLELDLAHANLVNDNISLCVIQRLPSDTEATAITLASATVPLSQIPLIEDEDIDAGAPATPVRTVMGIPEDASVDVLATPRHRSFSEGPVAASAPRQRSLSDGMGNAMEKVRSSLRAARRSGIGQTLFLSDSDVHQGGWNSDKHSDIRVMGRFPDGVEAKNVPLYSEVFGKHEGQKLSVRNGHLNVALYLTRTDTGLLDTDIREDTSIPGLAAIDEASLPKSFANSLIDTELPVGLSVLRDAVLGNLEQAISVPTPLMQAFYAENGLKDVCIDQAWSLSNPDGPEDGAPRVMVRKVSYTMPKSTLVPENRVNEVHELLVDRPNVFVIRLSVFAPEVPYGSRFHTAVMHTFSRPEATPSKSTRFRVSCESKFPDEGNMPPGFIVGQIRSGAVSETTKTWESFASLVSGSMSGRRKRKVRNSKAPPATRLITAAIIAIGVYLAFSVVRWTVWPLARIDASAS